MRTSSHAHICHKEMRGWCLSRKSQAEKTKKNTRKQTALAVRIRSFEYYFFLNNRYIGTLIIDQNNRFIIPNSQKFSIYSILCIINITIDVYISTASLNSMILEIWINCTNNKISVSLQKKD